MADFTSVRGGTVYDNDGDKVGTLDEVYTDNETGDPSFMTVNTGLFGTKTTFIPLAEARIEGADVRVPYTKAHIKDAPGIDPDAEISEEEQTRLYSHYSLDAHGRTTGTTGTTTGTSSEDTTTTTGAGYGDTGADVDGTRSGTTTGVDRSAGYDTSGPTTDGAMTRSEERLTVGTRTQEAGRARLRKYVTTERQEEAVGVSHEELRVEREPITEANRGDAYDGPAISEEEHEVVLHEERAVVGKEAVPVERVRVGTETVRETEVVGDDVRKEQIELQEDSATTGTRGTGRDGR